MNKKPIINIIQQQALQTPENVALVCDAASYTYRDLIANANNITRQIIKNGLDREDVVGILIARNQWMAIAPVGVLAAGCAYMPMDSAYPAERLNFMLNDSHAKMLIADKAVLLSSGLTVHNGYVLTEEGQIPVLYTEELQQMEATSMLIENGKWKMDNYPSSIINCPLPKPETLALLIYTSGSTGNPKGCMIEQCNISCLAEETKSVLSLDSTCRVASYASFSFVPTVHDIFGTLSTGGTLYIIPEDVRFDFVRLAQFIDDNAITHIIMSTMTGREFVTMHQCPSLRYLSVGGEKLNPVTPMSGLTFVNIYGSSEACGMISCYAVKGSEENIPIGKACGTYRLYIVGEDGQPVADGEAGELWISGPQLCRGYLNHPELTAAVFIDNPFNDAHEEGYERVFRTGDFMRRDAEGNLLFAGRRDGLVKVRGFRVELREVESAVLTCPGVKEATVQSGEDPLNGTYIVAYVTGDNELDGEAIKRHVSAQKPAYMVPEVVMQIQEIPRNNNGKVDRERLPKPTRSEKGTVKREAFVPENDLQLELYHIIAHEIGTADFGIHTPLLLVGMTSVSAIKVASLVHKKYGVSINAQTITKDFSLKDIEEAVDKEGKKETVKLQTSDLSHPTSVPLSNSQIGVYVDCINNSESTIYNLPMKAALPVSFDTELLARAVTSIIKAHPALSVHFESDGADTVQVTDPEQKVDIPVTSMSEEELAAYKYAFVKPFNLELGPVYRVEIVKTEKHVYLLTDIHHLVADGGSYDLFYRQLCNALEGNPIDLEDLSFADYVRDEKEAVGSDYYTAAQAFFAKRLDGVEGMTEIVSDLVNPSEQGSVSEVVTPLDLNAINGFCRQQVSHGITPAHFVLASVFYTLSRFTNSDSLCMTTVSNGRSNVRIADTMGMFVNTLALSSQIGTQSVMEFICETSEDFRETLRHENYPFAQIANDYGLSAEIMFAYQMGVINHYKCLDTELELENLEQNNVPKFPIAIFIREHDGVPSICLEYDNGRYSRELMESLAQSISHAVNAFISNPDAPLTSVSLLDDKQTVLLDSFNQTEVPYDNTQTIVSLFRQQAKATPQNIAVVYKDRQYTYQEVDELSERLACYIASKGLGLEDVVSVLIPRCEWMAIASLGVLKAGCAYQPLDPSYPKERLNFMMQDASAKLLISLTPSLPTSLRLEGSKWLEGLDVLKEKNIPVFDLHDVTSLPKVTTPLPVREGLGGESLFILLYTSGSTGVPKGCQLEHGNLVCFCHWYQRYYDLKPEHRVAAYASYGFDACMMDMYPALTCGATVHIIPEEIRLDLIALNDYFEREHITHSFMTTQVGYQFATSIENHSLKYLSTGGEKLASLTPPTGFNFYNGYGPTECTIFTTTYLVDKKLKEIPIGKPLDNMRLYVVDPQGHRLPVGAAGELWVSGPQVSRGYLNRPEKTAEVYIPNPFTENKKYARVYRSGDIVRYLPSGDIQFVGRRDGQVKIRGFRIELKEVEAVIREFPGIKDATVQAFDEKGGSGGKFIAAYIVGDEQIDIEALNNFIMDEKPPYMVPAVTMQIDAIPLNQNQKVNKKALPKPVKKLDGRSQMEESIVPMNILEKELHSIIAKIINTEDFGITTVLGYAGLTPIMSIKLAVQVNKRYGVTLDSKSLVKSGTLQMIENEIWKKTLLQPLPVREGSEYPQEQNLSTPIPYREGQGGGSAPLSFPQQGLYVECMKNPTAIVYNIPVSVTFPSGVAADKLADAVAEVVRLHPLLACHFELQDNETLQVWNKEHEDIVGRQKMSDAEYEQYKQGFVMPFRLNEGPLYRLEVVETDTSLYLLADFHHLIFDGASLDVFLSQVAARLNGEAIDAEQCTYADYVKHTEERPEAKAFFSKVLADCEDATELPADLQSSEGQGHTAEVAHAIDMDRIEQFCQTQGITPAHLLLGATYYTISRYVATHDVYMSTISNGRSDIRLSDTVGMFVNTLALHGHIGEGTVADFLKTVSTDFDEVLRHEQYPYARIAADYGFYSKINFVYQMGVINEYKIGDAPLDIETLELDIPKFKTCVLISPHQGKPSVVVEYDDAFYSQQMMAGLAESIAAVANHFIDTPDVSLRSISIMSDRQRQMVEPMHEEGRGDIPVLFLHHGMEQQAAQHPDRRALVACDATFTYAEFNAAANRIANALVERGVKPRDRVAMLLPRTSRVMLSMYGILKAGAAFIPCDPHYPADRIQLILDDSDARYIITDAEHASLVPADKALDVEALLDNPCSDMVTADITPDDLAYLIYTSGSTGRPKGVMLHHRGICNELTAHPVNRRNYIARNEGHAVLGLTSLSFDGSFVEHGLALFNGLTLVLVHDDYVNDPIEVTRLMIENQVDVLCSAQSRLVSFMASDGFMEAMRRCVIVMCGGEKFPDGLMRRLQEQTPNAHIFNCYGPTETTVESNCHELTHEECVTVGRPLLNMQECIVDQDLNELPVGVVGELLIGGVQVAHGYNNLPDKTAAAFITWKGQRFYRSGDFARWDEKGRVHILGRTDNQVKLRGQRIELGEIESVMMKVEGVNNVIVLIRKLKGKDHLCAYFVADREIPIEQIKAEISKSLTTYMVPTAYLQLPEMPVTPNGKINTKALPEPQMVAVGEYVAPQNETEQNFCDIFAAVLQAEKVGATDSFFDLGGTSLNVTRVIIEADKRGVHVAYGDVFANPTPRKLAAFVSGTDGATESDEAFADRNFNYIPIGTLLKQNTLDAFREGSPCQIGNALLTGSTGYLGIHILKELIDRNDVPVIWCMVRAESEEKAQNRLKSLLYYYFAKNYKELFGTRIRIVLGDVTQPGAFSRFGDSSFSRLETNVTSPNDQTTKHPISQINTVFNCAAVVKHFSSGTDIEDVNIGGAANCIKFCLKTGARLIQTSTYSIAGMSVEGSLAADTVLTERDLYFGQYLDNRYIHSKFVAERMVLDGIAHHGLKAKIMRLGNLAPRSTDGEFQINFSTNSSMGRIRVFKMLGCYPYEMADSAMEFSPINEVAQAVVLLSLTPDCCTVFHPYNNHPILFGDVLAGLSKVGGAPVQVEADEFARKMEEAKADPERAKVLQSLMAYQDMAHGQQVRAIEPVNQYTSQVLYRLGFKWSATSWDYIERFLIAINGFGYFE